MIDSIISIDTNRTLHKRKKPLNMENNTVITKLEAEALYVRKLILKTTYEAGCGHTGGSLSETEILVALFFEILSINPEDPRNKDRDRFILSKGHATPGYYSVLAARGFFKEEELATFDTINSRLQAHPDMNKCPGVDFTSGSLGQGLSIGNGIALGGEDQKQTFKTWVLLGDGESQEGQVWEAALYAGAHKTKRLIAIIDYNGVQLASTVADAVDLNPLAAKWEAFNWKVFSCDGHNMKELVETMYQAGEASEKGPVVIIAKTVKGKGVSFMEGKFEWHGAAPNKEEYHRALQELG